MAFEEMEYDNYMREGRWCESKADSYFAQKCYSDAKSWYYSAKQSYEKAYDVASRTNNIPTYEASSCISRVESAYRDSDYNLGKDWSLF